jgi:serine protease Do
MESGDVILAFNGTEVADTRELVRMVGAAPVGETVTLDVLRAGERVPVEVTLGRREDAEASALPASAEDAPEAGTVEALGLTLSQQTPELADQFGYADDIEGLVITEVDPLSDAGAKGLLAGDLVTEAGQRPVVTSEDFTAAVDEAREAGRKSLLVLVRRGGDPRFVALSLEEASAEEPAEE